MPFFRGQMLFALEAQFSGQEGKRLGVGDIVDAVVVVFYEAPIHGHEGYHYVLPAGSSTARMALPAKHLFADRLDAEREASIRALAR